MTENASAEMLETLANSIRAKDPDGLSGELAGLIVMSDRFNRSQNGFLASQLKDTNSTLREILVSLNGNGHVKDSIAWRLTQTELTAQNALKQAEKAEARALAAEKDSKNGGIAFAIIKWGAGIVGALLIAALIGSILI